MSPNSSIWQVRKQAIKALLELIEAEDAAGATLGEALDSITISVALAMLMCLDEKHQNAAFVSLIERFSFVAGRVPTLAQAMHNLGVGAGDLTAAPSDATLN